ncbi:hypothetical protein DACRYDRAFT_72082, partial [Dacryopinax primogenitus]
MDILSITQEALKNWSDEAQRAKLLSGLSAHLTDISQSSTLASCLCAMLNALSSGAPGKTASLTPTQLAAFLAEIKQSFPSSSSEDGAAVTPEKSEYSELIIDLIWTLDTSLEDELAEITAAIKAEWQTAKDAVKADAMEVDVKEAKPAVVKDDKPPEKSSDPQTERTRLMCEAHKRALTQLLKELVMKSVITHTLAVERLDQPLLIAAGLVRNGAMYEKKTRQIRTSLFYKQTKFNLLREESEGYSKLIVELLSHHDQPASYTWHRMISLIGFFDLDPHRVLDLIFDVMESSIMTKWQWFLDLLREAGWAKHPIVPEGKGKERESEGAGEEWIGPSRFEGMTLEDILKRYEPCDSLHSTVDEKIMDVPAQLLGFKFCSHIYNQPNTPTAPRKELYLMVAILIREGVVSLPALYPHLYPTEDDMKLLEERHQKNLKELSVPKRTTNALTRAAPLSEEPDRPGGYRPRTTTAAATAAPAVAPTGPRKAEPPNHKMGLLRALLSVGALRPALWILTKHPWMFGPYSALADLYLRLLQCSLEPLYSRISMETLHNSVVVDISTPSNNSGSSANPKHTITDLAPEPPRTAGTTFDFFYD